jgi:hypothetical protein
MKTLRTLLLALAPVFTASTLAATDPLEAGFSDPPDSAKPHTWWHWMNGNITREGITADLEAMKRVGVGGAQIFNVDSGIPHGPVQFMSPEWRALFKHAVSEADRLGIELCVHNCAGWSSSGGPWNTPEHAMQKVVAAEVRVKGPSAFDAALPQPETNLGFYRDIAVLAFPAPDDNHRLQDARPTLTSSVVDADAATLIDGDARTFVTLPVPTLARPQFVQLEFKEPFAARAVILVPGTNTSDASGDIQISDDGNSFRSVHSFTFGRRVSGSVFVPLGAAPFSAKVWRVKFTSARNNAVRVSLAEVGFSDRPLIENLESKAGYDGREINGSVNDASTPGAVVRKEVVDLTSRLDARGQLKWTAPPGDWIILRVGYTPTGRNNHPAAAEATGLECDKLSKEALDLHWAGFMQKILDDAGPLAGKSLKDALIDSYEVGGQNWTPKFREEFRRRRGYDLLAFLPVFTGRVVDSPAVTDRFLWDVRRTIADLFAENYYGHFAELCRKRGLLASIEPYTGPFESLQCGAPADIVMGEFWSGSQGNRSVKIASSVAHIYGKTLVGAESFTARPETGRWLNDPYSIKALGDLMYCQGLNRYIFHRYAMQPWTNHWPGMTMGQWGFHFERTVTWWEQSKPWLEYVARCQFLLQKGRAVADVAYFCGENAPVEIRSGNPALPAGYDWDAINADVLLHRATVKNGRLTLPDGTSYAALVLPPNDVNMTPDLLKRIGEFVREGATVVGPPPQHSPSLEDYPRCDTQVKELAERLWGKCDGSNITENSLGRGRVVWGQSLSEVLAAQRLKSDFEFTGNSSGTRLAYVHRTAGAAEIYFVSNQRTSPDTAGCTFRVSGRTPELWNAESGVMEPAPVWSDADGRTTVRLSFDPAGSVFVIFREPSTSDHVVAAAARGDERTSAVPSAPAAPKVQLRAAIFEAVDGAGSMDVKDFLAGRLAEGQFTILASNDSFGADPAPSHVKRLRLEYVLDGKPGATNIPENGLFTFPVPTSESRSKVELRRAVYEAPDGTGSMDVKERVQALLNDGQLTIRASNDVFGRDPSPNHVKHLRLEYVVEGKAGADIVAEGDSFTFPVRVASGPSPSGTSWQPVVRPGGAVVVRAWGDGVFEMRTAKGRTLKATAAQIPGPLEITGGWNLSFPPGWGAPASVTLDKLISWPDHTDNGVRYFSGTATYEKEIDIPALRLDAGRELWLDLGAVKNFAEISLNGRPLAILWKPPFRVNITAAARPGANRLEVKVTNLWPNRLIGDEQLPPDCEWNGKQLRGWPDWLLAGKPSPTGRLTFTTWHHWTKDSALLESGLLGPVTLQTAAVVPAE